MQHGNLAFTAVFLKVPNGYVGFVEELPQVTAQARTLEEARKSLHEMAAVIFDAERESTVGARAWRTRGTGTARPA